MSVKTVTKYKYLQYLLVYQTSDSPLENLHCVEMFVRGT
jgi:hypothetical protein